MRVKKVVSCLSTVMLPADATYPVNESAIHSGPPNPIGHGYAMAKRELDLLSRWISAETQTQCVCVLPSNIFGPGAKCDPSGPLLNALIAKAIMAKAGKPTLKLKDMEEKHLHNLFLKNMSGLIEEVKNPTPRLNP